MSLRNLYSNRKSQQLHVDLTEMRIWYSASALKAHLATATATIKRNLPLFVDCFDSLDVVFLTASVPMWAFRHLTGRHIAEANVAVGRLSVAGHVWGVLVPLHSTHKICFNFM
jgi:hypothetical protein